MLYLLSLFAAVAVQKNVRDLGDGDSTHGSDTMRAE